MAMPVLVEIFHFLGLLSVMITGVPRGLTTCGARADEPDHAPGSTAVPVQGSAPAGRAGEPRR
jgi:hypothetical protein